jgi:hypothetical protein
VTSIVAAGDHVLQVARDQLADQRRYFYEELNGRGDTKVYRLQHVNVDPVDLAVEVTGVPAVDAEVIPEEGYLRFTTPPDVGDLITVEGYHWDWNSDATVKRFATYVADQYRNSEGEERFEDLLTTNADFLNLMGLAPAVAVLWAEWTYVSRQIDTSSPEVTIPVRQRFQQLEALLMAKQAELRKAEEAMNIGRYKIEMLTLRRVSKTTGRYVPIYIDREFDDWTIYPVRVFPPIDDGVVP